MNILLVGGHTGIPTHKLEHDNHQDHSGMGLHPHNPAPMSYDRYGQSAASYSDYMPGMYSVNLYINIEYIDQIKILKNNFLKGTTLKKPFLIK